MWLLLAFVSATLLGLYDVVKKISLERNAVIPVLFLNIFFCCLLFLPVVLLSALAPDMMRNTLLFLPAIGSEGHFLLFLKAVIVLASWIFAYFSLKHLPITIASPIKATQPILTLLGALLVFGERLNIWQWAGVLTAVISLFLLSRSGKKEGIRFAHNKWIYFMILAVVTGSVSGLYDKYLMTCLDRMGVILFTLWYPGRKKSTPFQWRNTIPFISILLVLADFVYFYALSYEDSMISIISLVRRSGGVVSFIAGAIWFKERNLKAKFIDLLLVLAGMYLIYLGTR